MLSWLIIFKSLYFFLSFIIFLLLTVAFYTLLERQVLGSVQRRTGPEIVGPVGLAQPIADGVKLFLKETIIPKAANKLIFILAPIFCLSFSLLGWLVMTFTLDIYMVNLNIAILYIFAISTLNAHTIIFAGWASNSKYAFLGCIRSAAQFISYELSLGLIVMTIALISGSFCLQDVLLNQSHVWHIFSMAPLFAIFFSLVIAETNRHPFDLPEAESELVSGFNVEYSAMSFALFFVAEYSNIILMSCLIVVFFLGGSSLFEYSFYNRIFFIIKLLFFMTLFIVIRAVFPRFRFDQLMRLGWKCFLPITLSFHFIYSSCLISFDYLYNF